MSNYRGKKLGTKIFVETCPHYLTLSYEKQQGYLAKVMPPIRTENDRKAIWNALSTNLIDTIGTDHVANQLKLKLDGDDVWGALAGFPGIGTVLPILLNDGVNQNKITLEQFVQFTSTNAAKIFGMYPQKGFLAKDSDADIAIIDLKKKKLFLLNCLVDSLIILCMKEDISKDGLSKQLLEDK